MPASQYLTEASMCKADQMLSANDKSVKGRLWEIVVSSGFWLIAATMDRPEYSSAKSSTLFK